MGSVNMKGITESLGGGFGITMDVLQDMEKRKAIADIHPQMRHLHGKDALKSWSAIFRVKRSMVVVDKMEGRREMDYDLEFMYSMQLLGKNGKAVC